MESRDSIVQNSSEASIDFLRSTQLPGIALELIENIFLFPPSNIDDIDDRTRITSRKWGEQQFSFDVPNFLNRWFISVRPALSIVLLSKLAYAIAENMNKANSEFGN